MREPAGPSPHEARGSFLLALQRGVACSSRSSVRQSCLRVTGPGSGWTGSAGHPLTRLHASPRELEWRDRARTGSRAVSASSGTVNNVCAHALGDRRMCSTWSQSTGASVFHKKVLLWFGDSCASQKRQNHRIAEWFGLEEALN